MLCRSFDEAAKVGAYIIFTRGMNGIELCEWGKNSIFVSLKVEFYA